MEPAIAPGTRLSSYLGGLPAGLDSYPACLAKGSVFRVMLEGAPLEAAALPAPLRRYVREPPIASEWLPEVHLAGVILCAAEQRRLDDRALLRWVRQCNRALFEGAVYRTLMALVPPASLVRFSTMRWAAFHRGSTLTPGAVADDGVRVHLTFPPGLFDGTMLRVFGAAFQAALELTRAPHPEVELEEMAPGAARFRARWG